MNLGCNNISDISILEKGNFKELKRLDLYGNNISNINIFEKVKFKKLEKLRLSKNKIDEIKSAKIISNLKSNIKDFSI